MASTNALPRILVIDDLFGRTVRGEQHRDRRAFCKNLGIVDVTGDCDSPLSRRELVDNAVAEAVFCRGQQPACAEAGDIVENDLEGTLEIVRSGWDKKPAGDPPWALVVLDMCFYTGKVNEKRLAGRGAGVPAGRKSDSDCKKYFGLEILRALHNDVDPDIPVVILSSMQSKEIEDEWEESGGLQFIERNSKDAREQLANILERAGVVPDLSGEVVGTSLPLLKSLRMARNIGSEQHVALLGSSGTGKELFAKYIHRKASKHQKNRPFVVVDLQNISSDLVASELFGIGSGVATDVMKKDGLLKAADGGDIFFDEIGCVDHGIQKQLLRVANDGTFRPVGSKKEVAVKVRMIFATDSSAEKAFLPTLLYRIDSTIELPLLQERREDIPALIESFIKSRGVNKNVSSDVLDLLCKHRWHENNVRGLFKVLNYAVGGIYKETPNIRKIHLPEYFFEEMKTQDKSGEHEIEADVTDVEDGKDTTIAERDIMRASLKLSNGLSESLPDLQNAIMKYLNSLLEKTRDDTAEGARQLSGTRAYKLMLPEKERKQEKNHTVYGSALFKKLLQIHPETTARLLEEYPALSEVWEWVQTRGGGSKKKKKKKKVGK